MTERSHHRPVGATARVREAPKVHSGATREVLHALVATLCERPAELLVVGGARSHPKSKAWANPQAFDYFDPLAVPVTRWKFRPIEMKRPLPRGRLCPDPAGPQLP
jgi:hypothetical protein